MRVRTHTHARTRTHTNTHTHLHSNASDDELVAEEQQAVSKRILEPTRDALEKVCELMSVCVRGGSLSVRVWSSFLCSWAPSLSFRHARAHTHAHKLTHLLLLTPLSLTLTHLLAHSLTLAHTHTRTHTQSDTGAVFAPGPC